MLIDAAKGLEPQTLKLFQVCRHRGIPVITVINKWDRPGQTPLELIDGRPRTYRLIPTPLFLPVGIAGDFRGLLDRQTGEYVAFTRTAGGAKIAPEEIMDADSASIREGDSGKRPWRRANCSPRWDRTTTREMFLAGQTRR